MSRTIKVVLDSEYHALCQRPSLDKHRTEDFRSAGLEPINASTASMWLLLAEELSWGIFGGPNKIRGVERGPAGGLSVWGN
jgi:hypothetical protein